MINQSFEGLLFYDINRIGISDNQY